MPVKDEKELEEEKQEEFLGTYQVGGQGILRQKCNYNDNGTGCAANLCCMKDVGQHYENVQMPSYTSPSGAVMPAR